MPHAARLSPSWSCLLPTIAIACTAAICLLLGGALPPSKPTVDLAVVVHAGPRARPAPQGVRVALLQDGRTFERTLPAAGFTLDGAQTLDPRLAPGPFEATFTITLPPTRARAVRIGARFSGGVLLVRADDAVILADAAGADERESMTALPIAIPASRTIVYSFRRTGEGPAHFRALWQPEEALLPLPLTGDGAPLAASAALRGEALFVDHRCAACHAAADPVLQARLDRAPAPALEGIGDRVRAEWIRAFLQDPAGASPGTLHPVLPLDGALIDALARTLAPRPDRGGDRPAAPAGTPPPAEIVAAGRAHFHLVGCVACHGPREPAAVIPGLVASPFAPQGGYVPLGALGRKWRPGALARYLRSPLATHPAGRMPDLALSDQEAEAIAAYLLADDPGAWIESRGTVDAPGGPPDAALLAAAGCTACHGDRGVTGGARQTGAVEGGALSSITIAATACLGDAPTADAPWFPLAPGDRADLLAFLHHARETRSAGSAWDALAVDMTRLRCTACHAFHGEHGPEAAIRAYFVALVEADMGDEGRLPPDLSDAGGRLTPTWMRAVLEDGARSRPWLAARMPTYGDAAAHLPALLHAASGVGARADREPEVTPQRTRDGRELVGARGLNCLECHGIAGHPSTGTPGPDLVQMVERLHPEAFRRWLADPTLLRPGTRMPAFFMLGRSPVTSICGAEALCQIDSIRAYLLQGSSLPLPEGLSDPTGFELVPGQAPIIFRTFMKDVGVRAIAVGFPEGVHGAFDAERCEPVLAWSGRFLNAQGAWGGRGGTETNPDRAAWRSPPDAWSLRLVTGTESARAPRFRGYRVDGDGRPVFLYDLQTDGSPVHIEEAWAPSFRDGHFRLRRTLTLRGAPDARVAIGPALGASTPGTDRGRAPDELRLDATGRAEIVREIPADADGESRP